MGYYLEYCRTLFESEICEMLQFMHVKILFLKFSLCQGTLRDGRGTQGEGRQARQAGPRGVSLAYVMRGALCVVFGKLIAAANCPIFS